MSLDQLPFEILNDIFSRVDHREECKYGDNGHAALCSLALTCRRLSAIAVDLIYAHIDFKLDVVNRYLTTDVRRIGVLNNCLRASPALVNRIRSAEIRCPFIWGAPGAYDELLDHLGKSTSLTRLRSELSFAPWTELRSLYDYPKGSFPRLRHLEIEIRGPKETNYLPAERLALLCELPSLETLTVRVPVSELTAEYISEATFTRLTHLHFISCPVSVEAIELIIPRAPNLACLQLTIPGDASEDNTNNAKGIPVVGYELLEPLRPAFYGTLLAPVSASLKNLVLNADRVTFKDHDGSRIDLSGFTNLSRLDLNSSLIFTPSKIAADCPWSLEISQSLPPRLDSLHLKFSGLTGVFWSLSDMRSYSLSRRFDELWGERLNKGYIRWLVDLLDKKCENKVTLESIIISEEAVADRIIDWKIVQWHMTDHLIAAARAARVELIIRLRVPLEFQSPEIEEWKGPGLRGGEVRH
ncbi:hypothetical protein AAE478_007975 [Parahypoxylon ruwenzoriense]